MNKKTLSLWILAILLGSAKPAACQEDYQLLAAEPAGASDLARSYQSTYSLDDRRRNQWAFDAGFGLSIPLDKSVTSHAAEEYPFQGKIKQSWTIMGQARYYVSDQLSVGARLNYTLKHELDVAETAGNMGSYYIEHDFQILGLVPTVRWGTHDLEQPINYYLTLGIGGYQLHQSVGLIYAPYNYEVAHRVNSEYYLGAAPGVGLSLNIGDGGRIGAEVQYERIFAAGEDLVFLKPTLFLSYRF